MAIIMMVDDNRTEHFITKHLIGTLEGDYEVMPFTRGKDALEYLEDESKQRPDLVLLDINMPDMDGFAFLEVYKSSSDDVAPVIIQSASTDEQEKELALRYDFVHGFISKPLTERNINLLQSVLGQS